MLSGLLWGTGLCLYSLGGGGGRGRAGDKKLVKNKILKNYSVI